MQRHCRLADQHRLLTPQVSSLHLPQNANWRWLGHLQHRVDALLNARVDLGNRRRIHVSWRRRDLGGGVDNTIRHRAILMLGAHRLQRLGGASIVANRQRRALLTQRLGDDRGCNADRADGFARRLKALEECGDIGVDRALGPGLSKSTEVLGRAIATGQDHRVEVLDLGAADIGDLAARDAGGFGQDVAGFRGRLALEVIDDGELAVGGEDADRRAGLGERQQGADGFVDLGPVHETTTGEDDCDAFVS